MKKRVILTTLAALLLLFATVAAGLSAVYTVTGVRAQFHVFSAEGRAEAAKLEEELQSFVGKSSAFLDLDDVVGKVESYPSFCVKTIRKKLPQRIELTIAERREAFALEKDGTFAVYDEEGKFLFEREENVTREGDEGIVAQGFTEDDGYFEELFSVYGVFREEFGQVRANVLSFRLERDELSPNLDLATLLVIGMREGVKLRIVAPASLLRQKTEAALARYRTLTDAQRLYGTVIVVEQTGGNIRTEWVSQI